MEFSSFVSFTSQQLSLASQEPLGSSVTGASSTFCPQENKNKAGKRIVTCTNFIPPSNHPSRAESRAGNRFADPLTSKAGGYQGDRARAIGADFRSSPARY